ncbi:MAG: ABC-type transport auxiliary lipoprotein family protein [Candidatus Hydrogenedentes bacterium]|nr:ABC-type transport auxiliary lipoprotein family protein [Candidatus Hydrogenedentota bacterium]
MGNVISKRAIALGAALAVVLAGCLGTTYTPTRYYTLNPDPDPAGHERTGISLGIYKLGYARMYKQPMVYTEPGRALGYDEFHQWAEMPRDTITRAVLDAVASGGGFADVAYAFELSRPDLVLTGEVRKFDQVRDAPEWRALCEVRFELRERFGDGVLWGETLSAESALPSNDPSGFAAAMSLAVTELAERAAERIANYGRIGAT